MFSRVLIANRGEIACRVMATCKRLGIHTIAVYSDADARARHVRLADESIPIGGAAPADSYLNIEKILAAAKQSRADAIHPGYGFLSENPQFAAACEKTGLVFVGPRPETMQQMGAKANAKRLMESAGVPVVPGYHGDSQETDCLVAESRQLGFPLMIKASAGGGGKGMRVVTDADSFVENLEAARREARGAFGDEAMILEKYVEQPRHIEFQIFGDHQGNIVHLFERECSIQRRYQKIIEETPSPFLDDKTRSLMAEAAVAAAGAVDYLNAGTVEFIVGEDRTFYFMEMNTRLQVEHPVTEMTTGLDLVEWQLRVAAGESLPLSQEKINRHGHSIEARIYAEDPAQGFLPSSGKLELLHFPQDSENIRTDSAVETGDKVTVFYDPMIAKLVVWDQDRDSAVTRLKEALAGTAAIGINTNIDFLERVVRLDAFSRGQVDTSFVDKHVGELTARRPVPGIAKIAAVARHLLDDENQARRSASESTDPFNPWAIADAWRFNRPGHRLVILVSENGERTEVDAQGFDGKYRLSLDGKQSEVVATTMGATALALTFDDTESTLEAFKAGDIVDVVIPRGEGQGRYRFSEFSPYVWAQENDAGDDRITAPMPGKIVAIRTEEGAKVQESDELIIMEAMKMEITLRAPYSGTVVRVRHREGDFVEADTVLIEIDGDQA